MQGATLTVRVHTFTGETCYGQQEEGRQEPQEASLDNGLALADESSDVRLAHLELPSSLTENFNSGFMGSR